MTDHYLIIGASSAIASALIERLRHEPADTPLITAISRAPAPDHWPATHAGQTTPEHPELWLQNDYQPDSIEALCRTYQERFTTATNIIICNGKLHEQELQPEKRLADFTTSNFQTVLQCNTLIPMLWLQALQPLIPRKTPVSIAVLSARVGSIEDNRLGGWYSYRASKAALNMLIKSFAIESARSRPQVNFLLFHPGTTDTPLSKPFQKNVPAGKLFSPAFVAQRLLALLTDCRRDNTSSGNIRYLDWDGKHIPW